jgi:hypothetical protein
MALQVYRGGATAVQPVADPVKSPDSLMVSVLAEPEVVRKRRGDKWSGGGGGGVAIIGSVSPPPGDRGSSDGLMAPEKGGGESGGGGGTVLPQIASAEKHPPAAVER